MSGSWDQRDVSCICFVYFGLMLEAWVGFGDSLLLIGEAEQYVWLFRIVLTALCRSISHFCTSS